MGTLHLGVLLAAAWAVLAVAFLHLRAKAYGQRTLYSKPAGDPRHERLAVVHDVLKKGLDDELPVHQPCCPPVLGDHDAKVGRQQDLARAIAGQ